MTVEQAAGTPGGGGIWRVLAAPLQLRTWTATIYLLASMFVGLAWFVILSVGLALGAGLLIVWVGVLVLALTLLAWRGGAWLERRWVRAMLGVPIPEPYRPLPAGSLWQRARVLAGDPATWKDLAYLVLLFPLGMVWFVVTTTLWTFALGLLTAPLWYWTPSEGGLALLVNGERSYLVIDTLPEALLAAVAGAVLVVAAAWAVRGMAAAQGALALALLGPSDSQLRAMLGVHVPDPYRPLPAGSLWQRARVLAGDPATWKDLAYLVLLFPLGLVWFVVTTTLWTFALGLLTAPLWYLSLIHI